MSIQFLLGNRYRLVSPLGEGGMASVFTARDERLGRKVAVKILADNLVRDPGFIKRFQTEAESAANLSHPNIVSVFDVGQDEDRYFIVMELISGRNLKEIIQDRSSLPPAQAIAIGSQVLDGLQYAHEHGLIHRDIKPQNILVTREGVAKLADFGIAKAIDATSATQTAAVLGSAHYLSPEQAQGDLVTPQSDIYSMSVVLYEMVTGQVPFDGSNLLAVASRHINDEPDYPSQLNPEIPNALSQVIVTGMSKDPADRYATASDMQAELTAIDLAAPERADLAATAIVPKDDVSDPVESRPIQVQNDVTATRPSVLRFGIWAAVTAAIAVGIKIVNVVYGSRFPDWLDSALPWAAAAFGAIAVLVIGWGLLERLRCRYVIDRHAVTVELGILGHHRDAIPLPAIVNLQLHQSPVARLFDVGTIVLTTVQVPTQGPVMLHLRNVAHASDIYDIVLHRIGSGGGPRPSFDYEPSMRDFAQ